MNEMDILTAIGQADELYLMQTESSAGKVSASRSLWRIGLVAAAIFLLAMTVMAAPAILRGLKGGTVETRLYSLEEGLYFEDEDDAWGECVPFAELSLDIDVQPDAPQFLEVPHVPRVLLDNYSPTRCVWKRGNFSYWVRYYFEDNTWIIVRFDQFVIPDANSDGSYPVLHRGYSANSVMRMIKIGNADVFEMLYDASKTANEEDASVRQLYWSDGEYIYYLYMTTRVPQEFYESLVTSLQPIDDITPYLTENKDLRESIEDPAPTSVPPVE